VKTKLPWFKFMATSWIADPQVTAMSARQVGWYIRLLAYCWQEGGLPDWGDERNGDRDDSLPRTLAQIHRDITFVDEMVDNHDSNSACIREIESEWRWVLAMFSFKSPEGRRFHPKLYQQYTESSNAYSKRVEAAEKTNKKRGANRNADRSGNRSLRASESESKSSSEDLKKEKVASEKTRRGWFESEFWPIVWKKTGVGAARSAWLKNIEDVETKDLAVKAAKEQAPQILARGRRTGATTLHPATWLNQERFRDEPDPSFFDEDEDPEAGNRRHAEELARDKACAAAHLDEFWDGKTKL
jgi:hypothetical protein